MRLVVPRFIHFERVVSETSDDYQTRRLRPARTSQDGRRGRAATRPLLGGRRARGRRPVSPGATRGATETPDASARVRVASGETLPEDAPNRYGAEVVVFEWLDFLVEKAGFENTGNALAYYEEIDWLSEDAYESLRAYMFGFSESDRFGETGPADLDTSDHVVSLVYIARLASL
ncbi:FlaD/FlaE family flagellar protein [Haladaptatus sp. NG-WS-4]